MVKEEEEKKKVKVKMEMGGKYKKIVFEDEDIESELKFMVNEGIKNEGKKCYD